MIHAPSAARLDREQVLAPARGQQLEVARAAVEVPQLAQALWPSFDELETPAPYFDKTWKLEDIAAVK